MSSRRTVASAALAAAALIPPVFWLWPALASRLAPSFRDQGDFFYPLKLYTAERLAARDLPLWNPLSGAGEPWLANAQSGVFYPPTWLFLLPWPALAAGLFLLLHFALASWGSWKFLKAESASDTAALFGSAAFVGCGFAASLSAYWNHFGGWAYLPGIAALARSGLPTRASCLGVGALLGLQAMAGSPEISAASALLALVLVLFPRAETPPRVVPHTARRRLLRLAAAGLLGLGLSAWVLLPLAELILQSDRRAPLAAAAAEQGAVDPQAFASLTGLSREGSGTPYLASLFVGPLLLFAAAAAPLEPERRRLAILLAALGVLGVLAAAAGPPGSWLRRLPPLDRVRYPAKALALSFFSLAMLGGIGADSLRFLRARGRARLPLGVLGALALAATLFSPLPLPTRAAGAIGTAALLLCVLPLRSYPAAGALCGLAALCLTATLAMTGGPLFRFVPEAEIRREPVALARLRQVNGRVLTPPMAALADAVLRPGGDADVATLRRQREALLGYTNLLYRIPTVRTAAALPTEGARRVADAIDASADPGETAGHAGARALWTPFRPSRLPSRKVGDFFRAPLDRYRPRVTFARTYRVEPDPGRAWRESLSPVNARAGRVALDDEPEFRPAIASRPLLVARVSEDEPERVAVDVTANSPGLLVLADLHYPGWTAETDGRRVPLLRADGVFRAVSLPAGSHRVVFRYRPVSVMAGAAISIVAVVVMLLLLWRGEPIPVGRRT